VPLWHARAPFRFQAGLADDFLGYEIPAWGFAAELGVFKSSCFNNGDDKDRSGHQHKLEDEGVGPGASNEVARQLVALLDEDPDTIAEIRPGRYVHADGSVDRDASGAVAVWLAAAGATQLRGGDGKLIALSGIRAFGSRQVDVHGRFADFDGLAQEQADLSTRGMLQTNAAGDTVKRYYLDPYPALEVTPLGAMVEGPDPAHGAGGGVAAPLADAALLLALAAKVRRRRSS
jgi:hypothetical protein